MYFGNRVGRFPAGLSATPSSPQERVVEWRHPSRLSPATSLEEEFFFEILSDMNQAVPNHLADESQTR